MKFVRQKPEIKKYTPGGGGMDGSAYRGVTAAKWLCRYILDTSVSVIVHALVTVKDGRVVQVSGDPAEGALWLVELQLGRSRYPRIIVTDGTTYQNAAARSWAKRHVKTWQRHELWKVDETRPEDGLRDDIFVVDTVERDVDFNKCGRQTRRLTPLTKQHQQVIKHALDDQCEGEK
jgi:hypothetical protein